MKTLLSAALTALSIIFLSQIQIGCKKPLAVFNPDQPCPPEICNPIQDAQCFNFNSFVWGLAKFQQPEPQPMQEGTPNEGEEGNFICQYTPVKWAKEYNELYTVQPFTEVLWVGSLLDGSSISDGGYRPLVTDRDSLLISISLMAQSGLSQSIQVGNPSLSTIRDGITELLYRTAPEATPAFVNFEIEEVRAEEEVKIHLGANFKGWGAKVQSSFDWGKEETQSRYLIKFSQVYYSVEMDLPQSPCELFSPIPTPEEAVQLFQDATPVYVSSVKYGRMVYFMVESSESKELMKAALQASFSSLSYDVGVNISLEHREALKKSTMQALVIGGSADGAVKIITNGDPIEGLKQYIKQDADFSVNAQGVPISYTLRFLSDNSVANAVLAGDYTIRHCEIKGEDYTFHPQNGLPYVYCAEKIAGDYEFGANGPQVDGKVILETKNGNEIWAKIQFIWEEGGLQAGHPDKTIGKVEEEVLLHVLPAGHIIKTMPVPSVATTQYLDVWLGFDDIDVPPVTGGNFINKFEVVGDTSGDDLKCSGDKDSNVKIYFNPITITVKKQ